MSDSLRPDDPGVSPDASNNPFVRGYIAFIDWLGADKRHKAIAGLGTGLAVALIACLYLGTRPVEQIVTEVAVPVKAQLIAVTVQPGDDLGSIGARYGRSRIETVGFNLALIERNTVRCGDKKAGVCRRDRFGERDLAFDAIWPGDVVLVVPQDALDTPAIASNTTP